MQREYAELLYKERPKIVEIVSWAAGNGDRSENGDYLYGKKRLREIDKRLRYVGKRLESAVIVDPAAQQQLKQVFFGARVTYAREDGSEHSVQLVGVDEVAIELSKISWLSPVAKALMKAKIGDVVRAQEEAARRARSKLRRYCAANRLNRFATLTENASIRPNRWKSFS